MASKFRALAARLIGCILFTGPIEVGSKRNRMWFYPRQGVLLPAVGGGAPGGDDGEGDADADADKDGDADKDADKDKDSDGDKDKDADADADGDGDADKGKKDEPDWKRESRKHERRAKQEREAREKAERELKERQDADKSEQEKAVEKAREEGESAASSKFEAQRRDDKIENAVTKLALKGFKVKDSDEEKTLKFADPDDAQLRLDRALRDGDLSHDDIYKDGKVDQDAVTTFLTEVLEDHPRLRAEDSSQKQRRVEGDADAGKGKGGAGKELEEMSPDDHLKQIQNR